MGALVEGHFFAPRQVPCETQATNKVNKISLISLWGQALTDANAVILTSEDPMFFKSLLKGVSPLTLIALMSSVSMADLCAYEKQYAGFNEISPSDYKAFLYSGQSADQILISKSKRRIYLFKGSQVVKSFVTAFGDPKGPKHFEGDMKTPEGIYYIDSKNPQSAYHLSLKISYPNAADIAYAKRFGKAPGGNIMVHGFPNDPFSRGFVKQAHPLNWTLGCVAVTDPEIEEIYNLVPEQTPVTICPL